MATVAPANSKRMYSWWWDSHISPKNSKWLQENLTDMDVKVKQMIKLLEEDADSFARRAEMYYKKRPELMKLVEEFYRAYRALAERYDHATGVLRQAHRTMAEAFPNQVPLMLGDESPAGSASEGDPRTPDVSPIRSPFDPDELQKDASGMSHVVRRNGAFTEEFDTGTGKKGLKQFNDSLGSGGKARKGLNFQDAENPEWGVKNNGNHDLKAHVESEHLIKAELETSTLKDALSKLEAEKEAAHLQYQQTLERLSSLELEFSHTKEDSKELNEQARKAEEEVQSLKGALAKLENEREAGFVQCQQYEDKISNLEKTISQAQKDAAELEERAGKAEIEGNSLKQDLARLEAEKESALLQHKQCLVKISDMEDKLLHAEEDARKSSERADKAEKEVENLKQTLAKLTEEKEAAAVQYLQCLERITSLECKLAVAQEETQKLKSEIDDGVAKFMDAEERCLLLERSNQSMHSELESLSQKMSAQSEKLTEKQQELGRLWNSLQEERLRFVEAETAFQTLQHLHSQSQDELRSLVAEFQKRSQMLEDLEACNQNLQNEVEQIKGENKGLNEINLSSALTIQDLQTEILQLRETIGKLETEVELRVDERNALQQEIYCLKEELNDLNKNHQAFLGQVESVGLSPDSFVSRVKDLLDENMQLREDCERDRGERVVLLEKLNMMDKLIEKNAFLENSLSDLNVELEGVRDKVKVLEESCQSLLGEKSSLVDVQSTLVFQLQIASDNLNEVTEKNKSLEKSLLDAHSELEGLQVKSKGLEDSCLLLKNEKSDFAIAKESLTLQLDISQKSLESLNASYKELEEKHLRLEEERESMLHEVEGLRVCLSAEKQEHASLSQRSESQLAGMALQISKLQEEIHRKSYEYEAELDRAVNAQIKIFVLQESIQDFEEKNFSLLLEYQKLVETSKLSKKLISELEQENLEKQMEVKSLFDQTKVLREGLYHVLKTLDANQWNDDKAKEDKILLSLVLNKLQETQGFLFELQDENQKLVIENSLLVTLIRELQLEVANVMTAKNAVDQEFSAKCEQLLLFQTESQKLKEMNEELRLNLTERDQNEEAIKDELKNLQGQMFDLQVAHQNLQDEKCKVLDEQRSLMKSVSDLRVEKHSLEEEYSVIFAETLSQGILSLIFRDTITERSLALNELGDNLDKLLLENDNLKESVTVMKGKLDEIDAMEVEKAELIIMVEDLRCKYEGVEVIRADQATQITRLSGECDQWRQEVETARDASQKLEFKLQILQGESQQAKCVIERLNDELQNRTKEVDVWESQAEALFIKLQISSFQAALLEGKIHELAEICVNLEDTNHSSATEIDQLKDRVSTMDVDNGELTAQTNVYAMAFISLKDSITTMEKHTLSHVTLHEDDNQEAKDALEVDVENHQHTSEEQSALLRTAPLDLVELQTRIKAIEKAIVEKERLLALENSNSNSKLEAAMRQIEELKSGISLLQSVGITKLANAYLNDKELGPGRQKHSHEISEVGSEVITKDIILDQISECSSYGISRRETLGSDDPILAMWETANHDGSNNLNVGKSQKVPTAATEKKHTRESFGEKELSIDKLEISKNFSGSRQEGNERKILERLDSDVQKLTNLETTVQDLKRKVEVAEKHRRGKSIEYDSVKEQLEESEEAITKLLDANRKLKKTVEDDSSSFDEKSALASDQAGVIRKRKISEQARRGSEKIGRLQLEVQKLQFLLAELDDEKKNKAKGKSAERKTRVLLRDYLYGGARTGPRRKKGHFCSCVQPATKED